MKLTLRRASDTMDRPNVSSESKEMTVVREEIRDMILDAATFALKETHGSPQDDDRQALLENFMSRIDRYAGRYPVMDLFNEFQTASDAGHVATIGTAKRMRDKTDLPPEGSWESPPITGIWIDAIKYSADAARKSHFQKAGVHFNEGREREATEELCKAITCSVAAIAARQRWPHQSKQDLANTITALATGTMPQEHDDIYELLQAASEQGQDLNSAFAAAMAQPGIVGDTRFYDGESGDNENAIMFAERTIELAYQLAGEPR